MLAYKGNALELKMMERTVNFKALVCNNKRPF